MYHSAQQSQAAQAARHARSPRCRIYLRSADLFRPFSLYLQHFSMFGRQASWLSLTLPAYSTARCSPIATQPSCRRRTAWYSLWCRSPPPWRRRSPRISQTAACAASRGGKGARGAGGWYWPPSAAWRAPCWVLAGCAWEPERSSSGGCRWYVCMGHFKMLLNTYMHNYALLSVVHR